MLLHETKNLVKNELTEVLNLRQSRPYVFRTRLERALERTLHISNETSNVVITNLCINIKDKLHYISDQSNQTSDGTLKSFTFLEKDIETLLGQLQEV